MKDILLYQINEMITNFIEAEHNGAIQITDAGMEDSGYHNDEERSLNINISYIPAESSFSTIEDEQEEPTVKIKLDAENLAANVNNLMAEEVRKNTKVTY